MAQYIYNELIDVTKLPTKTVTWNGLQSLQEAAKFLHLNNIIGKGPIKTWTITYNFSDKTLTFVPQRNPNIVGNITLYFYLLPIEYEDSGIKGHFNNNTNDVISIDTENGIVLTNDKLIIHLDTQLQGFMNPAYSYLQNGDYTYSELIEQGSRDVEQSQMLTDVFISGETKNNYPKIEIPLYGINGKCVRGYSDVLAQPNTFSIDEKKPYDAKRDVYYANKWSGEKTVLLQDSTKILDKQFRTFNLGLVKNTNLFKNIFTWQDYPAEQRVRVDIKYNSETGSIEITNYSLPTQEKMITYKESDFTQESEVINVEIPQNQGLSRYLKKKSLDLSWNIENWQKLCQPGKTKIFKTNQRTIVIELYEGESSDAFSEVTPDYKNHETNKTDGSWVRNPNYIELISEAFATSHTYNVMLKSNINADSLRITPSLYVLHLEPDQIYSFYFTNFKVDTLENPDLYFCSHKGSIPSYPIYNYDIIFKTGSLTYTYYDGKVTKPSECILLSKEKIDKFYTQLEYTVPKYDINSIQYSFSKDSWNDTYDIYINISNINQQGYSNFTLTKKINLTHDDACIGIRPRFFNKIINQANIKGLEPPRYLTNTEVPYYILNNYIKNYFLNPPVSAGGADYHPICPAFYQDTQIWTISLEDTLYGIDYNISNSCHKFLYNYQTLNTLASNWLENIIETSYLNQDLTNTDLQKYRTYAAMIVDNEYWWMFGDNNQQIKFLFIPTIFQNAQSLNGGTINGLMRASSPNADDVTELSIYPGNNCSISGFNIYAKEED